MIKQLKIGINPAAIVLPVLFFCKTICCFSQLDATVYEDFTQFFFNPYLVNPSATDSSYSLSLRLNNINELGVLKNITRFYVDGDKRIKSSRENELHHIGLQMTGSKLGDYISKSRVQVRYSWSAPLSRKMLLSSGVSLGFVNYAFLTTQGGTGGSDYAPDGAVGVHLLRKNTSLGFAIQQIFTPVLLPVNQSFRLHRLYNATFTRQFQLSTDINLSTQAIAQFSESNNTPYGFGMLLELYDTGILGVNNFSLRKTSFSAGVKQIDFLNARFMVLATYSLYHSTVALPDNALELFIAIQK